jgi:hypothetical protein
MLLRHSKDYVRTAASEKATGTTTRLVWRHGKGTTRSACAGTDDSAVLGVGIFIIVVVIRTKSVIKTFHIEPLFWFRCLLGKACINLVLSDRHVDKA